MNRFTTVLFSSVICCLLSLPCPAAESSASDQMIQTAYKNELGRLPDRQALRRYRKKITQQQWTLEQISADLQTTSEWKTRQVLLLVRQAFQGILKRPPTPAEQTRYQRHLLEDGWDKDKLHSELEKLLHEEN